MMILSEKLKKKRTPVMSSSIKNILKDLDESRTEVLYAYISKENKAFLVKNARELKLSVAMLVDKIITKLRSEDK